MLPQVASEDIIDIGNGRYAHFRRGRRFAQVQVPYYQQPLHRLPKVSKSVFGRGRLQAAFRRFAPNDLLAPLFLHFINIRCNPALERNILTVC